jgi:tight adherence protein B
MSADSAVSELAGLLKSGMPADLAHAELAAELEALTARQRAQLDLVWQLAMAGGGSVSGAIGSLGETFAARARHVREVELAFAGPKATAKLVAWLPVAGLALGQIFGLNPLGAVATKPIALIALLIGVLLLVLGRIWAKSIIRKSEPNPDDPGLYFDSIRFGILGGLPLASALESVNSEFVERLSLPPDSAAIAKLNRLAEINRTSGASIADLLAGEARARREARWFKESNDLAKLSVKLMIPLGVLTLPAFVLTTIVPVAISLLSSRQM